MKQTVTSWLQKLNTDFFMLGYMRSCHSGKIYKCDYMTTWRFKVCHELSMCHVHIYIRMKFLVSEFVCYFFFLIPS